MSRIFAPSSLYEEYLEVGEISRSYPTIVVEGGGGVYEYHEVKVAIESTDEGFPAARALIGGTGGIRCFVM